MPPSLAPSPTILTPLLPPKTLVGIDLITFTSTPHFYGIRDLPSGWHFLYTGTTESLSVRCGGWFYVGDISGPLKTVGNEIMPSRTSGNLGTDILFWKWDSASETLLPLKGDNGAEKQEAMRYRANLGAIWQSGGLFRYRSRVPDRPANGRVAAQDDYDEEDEEGGRRDWAGLTSHLSPEVLSRIVGRPDIDIDSRPGWMVTSASTAGRDTEHIPGLSGLGPESAEGKMEGELTFLPVDLKMTWRDGAIGRERTEAARDRSWALGDLIARYADSGSERTGETHILGELQFTFLMVLTLMNYSCLQQWKRLLGLLLTCRTAIKDRELFLRDVLQLLLLQLKRCDDLEGGFFEVDADEGGEFLRKLLIKFSASVSEIVGEAESAVKGELARLENWVRCEYGWELQHESFVRRGMLQLEDGEQVEMEMSDDEEEETGEYAPVVVDLGDGGTMHDEDMTESHMR